MTKDAAHHGHWDWCAESRIARRIRKQSRDDDRGWLREFPASARQNLAAKFVSHFGTGHNRRQ
jgi:hypothetical protein